MIILQIITIIVCIGTLGIIINGIEDYRHLKSKRVNNIIHLEPINSLGLPILKVHQGNKEYFFIIDTGANYSTLNPSTASDFQVSSLGTTGSTYGMEGNSVEVQFFKASFMVDSLVCEETFQTVDMSKCFNNSEDSYNVVISGLLGDSFLKNYGLVVDIKNNVLHCL